MAKDNPILPTPAGRKQVVVVGGGGRKRVGEEKRLRVPAGSWHREGQEAALGETQSLAAQPGAIPLCVQRCRQVSAAPALPHNVSTFRSDSPGPAPGSLSGWSSGAETQRSGLP